MKARPQRLLGSSACVVACASLVLSASADARSEEPVPDAETRVQWIEAFKSSPRGPFEAIRWFCADGTVHPPKPYPCEERGGGVQHGALDERARALRAAGYLVANVLADLQAESVAGDGAGREALMQILVERFLIGWDDGWIFRGAQGYRGALQIEDELVGAQRVLMALLENPSWLEPSRYFPLREAVRLLPQEGEPALADEVRRRAKLLAEADPGFDALRAKIHGAPDARDAARVRSRAPRASPALARDYEELAASLERLFAFSGSAPRLLELAERLPDPELAERWRSAGRELGGDLDQRARLAIGAGVLIELREALATLHSGELRLAALRTSLAVEQELFGVASQLAAGLGASSRRDRLALLLDGTRALYGTGLLGRRHLASVRSSLASLEPSSIPLRTYRQELRALSRVPEWCARWIDFHFGSAAARLAELDPAARMYSQDRLRSSPLLLVGTLLDGLVLDADRLAGVEHRVFGRRVGAGLRALNPGLARGVLVETLHAEEAVSLRSDAIALLPETTSDLPPVSGILTRGEGSSLSHIQLLARNLGIPNVVVGDAILPSVRARIGMASVLAVSPGGVVRLERDGPGFDAVFAKAADPSDVLEIRPDLEKLDLSAVAPIPLDAIDASDSGRICGPKAANLGELRRHFGKAVPDAVVVPFGAFRRLLDRPIEPGGPSAWDWMKQRYAEIGGASADDRDALVSGFLARLRDWIRSEPLEPALREQLRAALEARLGPDGSYGVFVRSDTNVEDLPGFTGAGLNLTVANVVGFDAIEQAVRDVWASPFTERAYRWRQSHMSRPEFVFPAVLVQHAFAAQKSGVMVTVDVDDGDPGWISVAVNEGVGGAVDGQSSESLRIPLAGGRVRFLAQATAPTRAVLSAAGGVERVPASGSETLLERDEVIQLVDLAGRVADFPALARPEGGTAPADIEFAFREGRLALLQIRPFVESRRARRSQFLQRLDAGLLLEGGQTVELDQPPDGEPETAP